MTTDDSITFYALPDELREAATSAACARYGVEDFFDLTPVQRREAYRAAVEPQLTA